MKKTLLIIGAQSDVGIALAHKFAANGYDLQLAARNELEMDFLAKDFRIRYSIAVTHRTLDILEIETFETMIDSLPELPSVAICVVGLLGEQSADQRDLQSSELIMRSNYTGPALFMGVLANRFEAAGTGTLVGVSSVAGCRGRSSNYIYGSAKSGFTAFLSGLRNRLCKRGVHVMTVLPGFISTKMVAGLDLPEKLTATTNEVADDIYEGVEKSRNVIYVKSIWRIVMSIIVLLPEAIFKRTSL